MANTDSKKALSFNIGATKGKIRKEKVSEKKSSVFGKDADDKDDEGKDFITAAENRGLKSVKEKPEEKELVIPMIKSNNWRLNDPNIHGIDKEAAAEILQELKKGSDNKEGDTKLTIPLLMQNRLPGVDTLSTEEEVYARDVSLRPAESTIDDYQQIPVSSFGSAMLRGMGWKEGQPIGLTNKGLSEPVEYIPRFKGLGLGAERRPEETSKRKRKLGEPAEDPSQRYTPIVEKDGKVRHVKGINEKVKKRPKGFHPGGFVQIQKGAHTGLFGKIVAVDEDNARLTVRLGLSNEVATVSQYQVSLVDEDEYKRQAAAPRVKSEESSADKNGKKARKMNRDEDTKDSKDDREPDFSASNRSWLTAGIRVRIISDRYKKGRYYNKKVKVLDVVTQDVCTCVDDGKILEGLKVSDLETVIPKDDNAYVLFVDGKYRGQIGKIIDKNPSKYRATVQLLSSDKHVTKAKYDNISEFVGELPDEVFHV